MDFILFAKDFFLGYFHDFIKLNSFYRKERLKQMGFSETDGNGSGSFAETYTLRRESILKSLQTREEEMRQKFVIR